MKIKWKEWRELKIFKCVNIVFKYFPPFLISNFTNCTLVGMLHLNNCIVKMKIALVFNFGALEKNVGKVLWPNSSLTITKNTLVGQQFHSICQKKSWKKKNLFVANAKKHLLLRDCSNIAGAIQKTCMMNGGTGKKMTTSASFNLNTNVQSAVSCSNLDVITTITNVKKYLILIYQF